MRRAEDRSPVLVGWLVSCALFTCCSVMCPGETRKPSSVPIPAPTPYRPQYTQCAKKGSTPLQRAECEMKAHLGAKQE